MSDEAQTEVASAPAAPDPPYSSEPEAFEFSIEIRMDATIAVNGQDWIKPGASTRKKWRVRDGLLPGRDELKLSVLYMQEGVLKPVLEEMIDLIAQRVASVQSNR